MGFARVCEERIPFFLFEREREGYKRCADCTVLNISSFIQKMKFTYMEEHLGRHFWECSRSVWLSYRSIPLGYAQWPEKYNNYM